MRTILLDGKPYAPGRDALPIAIHGKEGSGASLFAVVLAAAFSARGEPLVFWSAYPMAKKEFQDALGGPSARLPCATRVIEAGEPAPLEAALEAAAPDAVFFVKNFETVPALLRERLVSRRALIAAGDLEGLSETASLLHDGTRFFFSSCEGIKLPPLEKYAGYALLSGEGGFVRLG